MPKNKTSNSKINWKVLIISLIVVYVFVGLGSMFTKIDSWYYSVKPSITPPNIAFPIVWTILFFLIAISIYLSWTNSEKNNKDKSRKRNIIILFGINLILNALWSYVFFTMKNPIAAFVILILLWFSILSLLLFTWRISKKAGYCIIPYLLWVSFAGILNYLIAF